MDTLQKRWDIASIYSGVTQDSLSELLDVPKQTISSIKRGETPGYKHRAAIAAAFKVSVAWLFDGAGPAPSWATPTGNPEREAALRREADQALALVNQTAQRAQSAEADLERLRSDTELLHHRAFRLSCAKIHFRRNGKRMPDPVEIADQFKLSALAVDQALTLGLDKDEGKSIRAVAMTLGVTIAWILRGSDCPGWYRDMLNTMPVPMQGHGPGDARPDPVFLAERELANRQEKDGA